MTNAVPLTQIGHDILRGYRVLGACGLLGGALAGVYLALSPPSYQSEASVSLDPRPLRLPGLKARAQPITENRTAIATLESEVRIAKSTPVLLAVVDRLQLDRDPHFATPSSTFVERAWTAIAGRPTTAEPDPLPGHSCIADPSGAADCLSGTRLSALRQLQKAVTVQRASRSYVIVVRTRSPSPDQARMIADAIVSAYSAQSRESDSNRLAEARRDIESGLSTLEDRARAADRRIDEATRRLQIVDGSRGEIDAQQLEEVTRALMEARTRTETLRARDEQLSQRLRGGDDLDGEDFSEAPALEALRLQTANLAAQEGAAQAMLGPRHPGTAALSAQLKRNRTLLRQELARTAEAVHRDYLQARAVEAALSVRADGLTTKTLANSKAMVELRELRRIAAADGVVIQSSSRRAMELAQGITTTVSTMRVLGAASTPGGPATPRLWLVVVASAAGVTSGAAFLAVRSRPSHAAARSLAHPRGVIRL